MVPSCKSRLRAYSCVFEVTTTVSSCGSGAIALLPPRSLVRKAPYVASGAVREFERTGGKEPLVAARTYSKVPGRPRILRTSETPGQGPPAPRRASTAPASPEERADRAPCPAGPSGRPPRSSGRPPRSSGHPPGAPDRPGSGEAVRAGATPYRLPDTGSRPHPGRAGRGGQALRLNRGGGGDAGQRQS